MTDLIDLKACMITDGNRQRLGTLLRGARRDGKVARLILDRLEEKLELAMLSCTRTGSGASSITRCGTRVVLRASLPVSLRSIQPE